MLVHTKFKVSFGGVDIEFPRNAHCTIIAGEKRYNFLLSVEIKLQWAKISYITINHYQSLLNLYNHWDEEQIIIEGKRIFDRYTLLTEFKNGRPVVKYESNDFKIYGIDTSLFKYCKYVLISNLGDLIEEEHHKTVLSWLKYKLPNSYIVITTTSESILESEKPENIFRLNQ